MENLKTRAFNSTVLFSTVQSPQQRDQGGTYLPLFVSTLLAGAFLLLVLQLGSSNFPNKSIASIPYAGSEYGDVEQRKQRFLTEAGRLLQDGYNKVRPAYVPLLVGEGCWAMLTSLLQSSRTVCSRSQPPKVSQYTEYRRKFVCVKRRHFPTRVGNCFYGNYRSGSLATFFSLPTLMRRHAVGPTVVVSRKFIEELKNYPDDVVSFDKRAEKVCDFLQRLVPTDSPTRR
jgi:hypothetical protein